MVLAIGTGRKYVVPRGLFFGTATGREQNIITEHGMWLEGKNGGKRANLSETDLRGADLDFSVWPLWCGSLDVKVDAQIARQLAYHFCRLDCDDTDFIAARNAVVDFANRFHRVGECGQL